MKSLLIALLFIGLLAPAAQAEITIEDGGFTISHRTMGYVSVPNFKVHATPPDTEKAFAEAHQRTVRNAELLGKLIDKMIEEPKTVIVEKEVPVYVDRHHHHYRPVPAMAPVLLPCPLPAGVVLDSWITPYRRFRCSLGYTWYYEPTSVRWVRSFY